jgi:hypothetical protein
MVIPPASGHFRDGGEVPLCAGKQVAGGETRNLPTMSERLPEHLRRFFWETDFEALRIPEYQRYVIERLLHYGDDAAIRWVRSQFSAGEIGEVVRRSRALPRKIANFWGIILDIPREEIACFQKPSTLRRGSFSPHSVWNR